MTTAHVSPGQTTDFAAIDALIASARKPLATAAKTSRRAALYLRQSKTSDDGIDRQRERTTALAEARGWKVVAEYTDNDVSASKSRAAGTGWARMLADRASDLIDVVVAVDLDRLLRSTRDLNVLIDAGLMAVTVDGEIDLTTADGEFRATMLAGIARFEVRRKGERQSRANVQRAANGGVPKGARLFGYTTDGALVDDEADHVRALFAAFAAGDTLRTLARRFDSTPSSVYGRLTNPRYAGRRRYKGEVVGSGSWPAIVTPELFDQVQVRITDPGRKTNLSGSTARKHLGSGIYRCECGEPRPVVSGTNRYRCRACGLVRTRDAVDEHVVHSLLARLRQPDALAALAPQPADTTALLGEQSALSSRLASLAGLVADGTLDAEAVRTAAAPLRARLGDVERQLVASTTSPVIESLTAIRGRLDRAWPKLSLDRQRAILDAFMVVTLHRQQQGKKGFDPASVTIAWKGEPADS